MFLFTLIVLLIATVSGTSGATGEGWGYGSGDGSLQWPQQVPKWCSGRKQSPINVSVAEAVYDSHIVPHQIMGPPPGSKYRVKNDGKGFTVEFNNTVRVRMGNDMTSCFAPLSIHWHWGGNHNVGSEHWIEKKQYPIEGHIVMWNCRYFRDFNEAVNAFDGLAVLGVVYEESDTPDPSAGISAIYAQLTGSNAEVIRCPASNCTGVEIDAFPLSSLLPPNSRDKFFMYDGSLTTPDCRENVLWTVYRDSLKVSRGFMQAFRNLRTHEGKPMHPNYRLPLPLNPRLPMGGRRVLTRSFAIPSDGSDSIGSSGMSLQPAASCGAVLLLLVQLALMLLRA